MKVVTPLDNDPRLAATDVTVFLAGGISNCPDWQADMAVLIRKRFADPDDLVLFNPRRPTYEHSDEAARQQITWERMKLRQSQIILFWFPCETLCPITLFEYGYWLSLCERTSKPRLVVGCHPKYQRKLDLEVQSGLSNCGAIVRTDWDTMVSDLLEQYSFQRCCLAEDQLPV